MKSIADYIEAVVLAVHRRNGGTIDQLDFSLGLFDSELGLDSLDLAEVMVAIEREYHCSPFDQEPPPRTWKAVVRHVQCRIDQPGAWRRIGGHSNGVAGPTLNSNGNTVDR